MPTPFEKKPEVEHPSSNWAVPTRPSRSVFSNFKSELPESAEDAIGRVPNAQRPGASPPVVAETLQAAIDTAVARTFVYQFLARAFEDPSPDTWTWLTHLQTHAAFTSAVGACAGSHPLITSANSLLAALRSARLEPLQIAYVTAFGHAARGDCPLNEIEYGELKADALIQPHRLADLAAFYRAFGLEVADDAAERPDHIGMELEFMAVLAAKEAHALEHQLDDSNLHLLHDTQKTFLREHLSRWGLAFSRRLERSTANQALAALAQFTHNFLAAECARFCVTPGSEDLLLRPVDEATESLCGSCGLKNLPPGALSTEPIS
jgi:DMSO reductase family type II enzyme chaperone